MGGGYNTQFESFGHALDDRLASRSISLSVSIPLYNGGTLKNKYRISQIQMQKLKEQREYDKAVATADIVRDLYNINIIIGGIFTTIPPAPPNRTIQNNRRIRI